MSQLVAAALLLGLGALLVHTEPRRLANGVVLLAGLSLVATAVVEIIAAVEDDPGHRASALALLAVLVVLLLYAAVLALTGIHYGIEVLRRERASAATGLALVAGTGLLGYLVLGVVVALGSDPGAALPVLLSLLPAGYLGFLFTAFLGYSWLYGRLARRGPVGGAVVVLGAGLIEGRVTPLLAGRLARARELYDQGRAAGGAPVLVTSGGQGADEPVPEGRAMADWLVERSVPAEHVLVENRSRTTRENLLLSREVVTRAGVVGPVTVVTSDYHALRAGILMRTLGVPGQAVGAPTARYYRPSALLREFVALLRERWRLHLVALVLLTVPLVGYGVGALSDLVSG